MNIKFCNLFMVLAGLVCIIASARAENCDWANMVPEDDNEYIYIIARGSSDKSETEAENKVPGNLDDQLCQIIGVQQNTMTDSYVTENKLSSSATAQLSRCNIRKQNIRERRRGSEVRNNGGHFVCVLYSYPKKDLLKEQERIAREGILGASLEFNERSGESNCKNGSYPVAIYTNPEGAYVSIDDNKDLYGKTKIKFNNVCGGSRRLIITLNNYETIEEDIRVDENHRDFVYVLKRKTKHVEFKTNLGDSRIIVKQNDMKIDSGKEPFSYDFLLGGRYSICFENDIAEDSGSCKSVVIDESFPSTRTYFLTKYPGKIDFTVFRERNPDVRIFVDGAELSGNTTRDLDVDTEHKIVFEKKGGNYEKKTDSVFVKPKETFNYPSRELSFDTSKKNSDNSSKNNNSKNKPSDDGHLELSPLWLGIEYNYGNFTNDYGLSVPVKEFGLYGNLFLSSKLSVDFGATYGNLELKNEKDHDYENYIKNTSAASIFANNDPLVLNFDINQSFLHYYVGGTWYVLGPSSAAAIFVGGGYDWYDTLSYKQDIFYSNFIDSEAFKTYSSVEGKGAYISAGIEFTILRFTYKYGKVYNGISLELILPI